MPFFSWCWSIFRSRRNERMPSRHRRIHAPPCIPIATPSPRQCRNAAPRDERRVALYDVRALTTMTSPSIIITHAPIVLEHHETRGRTREPLASGAGDDAPCESLQNASSAKDDTEKQELNGDVAARSVHEVRKHGGEEDERLGVQDAHRRSPGARRAPSTAAPFTLASLRRRARVGGERRRCRARADSTRPTNCMTTERPSNARAVDPVPRQ